MAAAQPRLTSPSEEAMQTKYIQFTREPPRLSRQIENIDKNFFSFPRHALLANSAPQCRRYDMFGHLRGPASRAFSTLRVTCQSSAQSPHCTSGNGTASGSPRWAKWDMDHALYSNTAGTSRASLPPPLLSVAPMMEWTDNHYRQLARLLSRHTWLYTEMVVDQTILHQQEKLDRFLEFPACQHPVVLQLGGSDPQALATAASLADVYGYDEVNLNCGCPSPAVASHGSFGARLMLDPQRVGVAMARIADACRVPVTIKCRIGVDDADSYNELYEFVRTISTLSPVRHFAIHARKALLKGLSPAENRRVPPLRYEYVGALIRDFPDLHFTINGGITSLQHSQELLSQGVYGVMIGRAAYSNPWAILGNADQAIFGVPNHLSSRRQVLQEYSLYADSVLNRYGRGRPNVRALIKPLLGLFHAEPGANRWRQAVDTALRTKHSVSEVLEATLPVLGTSVLDAPVIATSPPLSGSRLNAESLPPPPLRQRDRSQQELVVR